MSAGPWLVLHLADNGRWMTTALTGTVDLQQACEMERALARNGCRTLVVDVDSIAADFASRAQTWPLSVNGAA